LAGDPRFGDVASRLKVAGMCAEWWSLYIARLAEMYLRRLPRRPGFAGQRGQNLVEYGLILLLAVLAVIGGLALIGPVLGNIFSNVRPAL
jgi:Flp pilus assembly pilin Flp